MIYVIERINCGSCNPRIRKLLRHTTYQTMEEARMACLRPRLGLGRRDFQLWVNA